jgi:imidazole glycerol phosphate synthase glutamine amidotransferase subunit
MITLISFERQSLTTLEGALDHLGFAHVRAGHPREAADQGPLILLAGGPLDGAVASLKASGWWRELPQASAGGRGVIGIGTGLHLLAEGSEECPRGAGLGLIPGIVRRLGPAAKVPHAGWAPVRQQRPHSWLPDIRGGWLYFAHSHALEPTSETLSIAVHGRPFAVVECRGRTVGIQAHPEKSGGSGLALLAGTLAGLGESARKR